MVFISERSRTALLAAAGGRRPDLRRLTARLPDWPRLARRGPGLRWPLPRWILLPLALPLFLVAGLAAGTLINLGLSGIGLGEGEGTLLTPASAATTDAGVPAGVCARMAYIVNTACALKQRDHDIEGTRRCVAHELKYTMWSAYGCG